MSARSLSLLSPCPFRSIFIFLLFIPFILMHSEEVFRAEGDRVVLSCGTQKLDKNTKITWKENNENLDYLYKLDEAGTRANPDLSNKEAFELDHQTMALIIIKLDFNTAATYTCIRYDKDEKQTFDYVVTAFRPIRCVYPKEKDMKEGGIYLFNHTLEFMGTGPVTSWEVAGRQLKGEDESDIGFSRETLKYEAMSSDDGKNLTFTYTLGDISQKCSKRLSILHPPKKVEIQANEGVVQGESVTCISDGNPKADLELKSNGMLLKRDVGKVTYKIPEDKEGNMTLSCFAKNNLSDGKEIQTTKTFAIIVKAAFRSSATVTLCSLYASLFIFLLPFLQH